MQKILKILLVLSWMGLIFKLSAIQGKSFPTGTTSFEEIIAHIFLYGVLSFLIYSAILNFRQGTNSSWQLAFTAVILSVIYGISDEYHQGFVFGRFVSFGDLFFDFLGAVTGILCYIYFYERKPKLILHICCAGCGAYISKLLKKNYQVVLYFYNPNIYPKDEFNKRLEEAKIIAKKFRLKLIAEAYDHNKWLKLVSGLENEPERGKRCLVCYKDRLEKTVKTAQKINIKYFTTTLTISPHKDAQAINKIGNKMAAECGIIFLGQDFKKNDGFKKSSLLSKELGLYRQDYCGCEFSKSVKL